jgi:hypothetical protein
MHGIAERRRKSLELAISDRVVRVDAPMLSEQSRERRKEALGDESLDDSFAVEIAVAVRVCTPIARW